MATKSDRRQRKKTTLAVLRSGLADGFKTVKRRDPKSGEWFPADAPKRLAAATVARWLGCSVANVRDIESAKVGRRLLNGKRVVRALTPEQGEIVAYQTGVNLRWLLDNDPFRPIINWAGKPYAQTDFDERQAALKKGKTQFSNPKSAAAALLSVSRPRDLLAECIGMLTAIVLRSLERDQGELIGYTLPRVLRKFYGEPQPGEDPHEFGDLIMKAVYGGRPSLTRPDIGPLLDSWEARLKGVITRKSGGKAPLHWPRPAPSLPAAGTATRKRRRR